MINTQFSSEHFLITQSKLWQFQFHLLAQLYPEHLRLMLDQLNIQTRDFESKLKVMFIKIKTIISRLGVNPQKPETQLMLPLWPKYLVKLDHIKFEKHFKILQKVMGIHKEHLCYFSYFYSKQPEHYQEKNYKYLLSYFQIHHDSINMEPMMDLLLNQLCCDTFSDLMTLKTHLFQEYKQKISSTIKKLLVQKKQILIILKKQPQPELWFEYFDRYFNTGNSSQTNENMKTLSFLKLMLFAECFNFYFMGSVSPHKEKYNMILIALTEAIIRLLNYLYLENRVLVFICFQWILFGFKDPESVWRTYDYKQELLIHLIALSNILKDQSSHLNIMTKKDQTLIINYIQQVESLCQDSWHSISNLYKRSKTKSLDHKIDSSENMQLMEGETISLGNNLKSQISGDSRQKMNKITTEIKKHLMRFDMGRVLILYQRLQEQMTQNLIEDSDGLYLQSIRALYKYKKMYPKSLISYQIQKMIGTLLIPAINSSRQKIQRPIIQEEYCDLGWSQTIEGPEHSFSIDGFTQTMISVSPTNYPINILYRLLILQNDYDCGLLIEKNQNKPDNRPRKSSNPIQQPLSQDQNKNMLPTKILEMIMQHTNKKQLVVFFDNLLGFANSQILATVFLNVVNYTIAKQEIITAPTKKIFQSVLRKLISHYVLIRSNKPQVESEESWIKVMLLSVPNYLQMWRKPKVCLTRKKQRKQFFVYPEKKYLNYLINLFPSERESLKIYAREFEKINRIKEAIFMLNHYHRFHKDGQRITPQESQIWQYFRLIKRIEPMIQPCELQIRKLLNKQNRTQVLKQLFNIDQTRKEKLFNKISQCNSHKQPQQPLHRNIVLENHNKFWFILEYSLAADHDQLLIIHEAVRKAHEVVVKLTEREEIENVLTEIKLFMQIIKVVRTKSINWPRIKEQIKQVRNYKISCIICNFLSKVFREELQLEQLRWDEMVSYEKYEDILRIKTSIKLQSMKFEELRACLLASYYLEYYTNVMVYYDQLKTRLKKGQMGNNTLRFAELRLYYMKALMSTSIGFVFKKVDEGFKEILSNLQQYFDKFRTIKQQLTKAFFQLYRMTCENYQNLDKQQQAYFFKHLNNYFMLLYESEITLQQQNISSQVSIKQLLIQALHCLLRNVLLHSKCSEILIQFLDIDKFRPEIISPHKDFLILSISLNTDKNQLIKSLLIKIAEYRPELSAWWISGLCLHNQGDQKMEKIKQQNSSEIDQDDSLHLYIEFIGHQIKKNIKMKSLLSEKTFQWYEQLENLNNLATDSKAEEYRKCISFLKQMDVPESIFNPFDPQMKLVKLEQIVQINDGKSKPLTLTFLGQKNGKEVIKRFLVKKAKASEYQIESCVANFIKQSNMIDKDVTYSITHLSKSVTVIEHIPHLDSLRAIMVGENQQIHSKIAMEAFRKRIKKYREQYDGIMTEDLEYHLHDFFQKGEEVSIRGWFEKMKNFVRTLAQWSYLIYVIHLGDRHDKNILVKENGKVVHIDFQVLFSSGLQLPCPQWVPFRITHGLANEISIIEPFGLFYCEFIKAALKYKKNKREFWAALSFFAYYKSHKMIDSIVCRRAELKQKIEKESLSLIRQSYSNFLLREMYAGWSSYI